MPFSSQLDFLGIGVPYWYYISGNGVAKEQVPSEDKLESELENFLEERVELCDFSAFEEEGFEIEIGQADADVIINERDIVVSINQNLKKLMEIVQN